MSVATATRAVPTRAQAVLPEPIRSYRPDIQGLRGIAVLVVVLYHAGVEWLPGGYVGVDVFFVISGFLITRHLLSDLDRPSLTLLRGFWVRRIRRLLPSAALVLVVTLIAFRIWGAPLEIPRVGMEAFAVIGLGVNVLFAVQGIDYLQIDRPESPLQHFWSLAVEEQFYLIWPVLLLLLALASRRLVRRVSRVAILSVVLLVVAGSFSVSVVLSQSDPSGAYFLLQSRAWELAVGAVVALVVTRCAQLPAGVRVTGTWLGLAGIGASVVLINDATPFPGWAAVLPVLSTALVIAAGVRPQRGSADVVLAARPLGFLGAVSYTWYLWHWPVLLIAPAVFGVAFGLWESLAMCVVSLWFAVLTTLLVERPLLGRGGARVPWVRSALVVAVVAALVAGVSVVFPPMVAPTRASIAAALDRPEDDVLAGLVAAGSRLESAPANLRPGVAAAADDVPATTRDGCHLGFSEVAQPDCVFGDRGASRTVVLFGDSHAEQWFGAVEVVAREQGWRLLSWTKAACPVADLTLWNENIRRNYTECAAWRDERLRAIGELKPDLVIASQADTLPGPAMDDAVWAAATARTVDRLEETGAQVLVIADTPRPRVDVPACVAEHMDAVRACAIPTAASAAEDDPFSYLRDRKNAMLGALAGGPSLIDPTDWMCTEDVCPVVVGDTLVYRDASHITATFSVAASTVIGQGIEAAMG